MVFFETEVVEGFLCDSHHSQTSIVGKTEAYNELFKNSESSKFCREFTCKNSRSLDFVASDEVEDEDDFGDDNILDEDNEDEDGDGDPGACPQFSKTFYWEASRISLSKAVWLYIAILEASENKCLDKQLLGPMIVNGKRLNLSQSLKIFMEKTDAQR